MDELSQGLGRRPPNPMPFAFSNLPGLPRKGTCKQSMVSKFRCKFTVWAGVLKAKPAQKSTNRKLPNLHLPYKQFDCRRVASFQASAMLVKVGTSKKRASVQVAGVTAMIVSRAEAGGVEINLRPKLIEMLIEK